MLNASAEKQISAEYLTRISVFCFLTVIAITIYGFFSNFDITDEGYVLYHHMHGPSEVNGLLGFHFFTHPIGFLFNHTALGYRFLDLFLAIAASLYLTVAINSFFKYRWNGQSFILCFCFIAICTLGYFVYLITGHYNLWAIVLGMGWGASVLLHSAHSQTGQLSKHFFLFLTALLTIAILLTKFTFGFFLILCFPILHLLNCFLFKVKAAQDIFLYFIYITAFSWLIYQSQTHFWHNFWEILTFSQSENMLSGQGGRGYVTTLIFKYLNDFTGLIKREVLITFAILFSGFFIAPKIIKKYTPSLEGFIPIIQKATFTTICIAAMAVFALHDPDIPRYFEGVIALRILMSASILAIIFMILRILKHQKDKENFNKNLFFCLSMGTIFLHPVGTNTNYFGTLSLAMGAFGALFFVLFYMLSDKFHSHRNMILVVILGVTGVIGYSIYNDQVLRSYRNAPYPHQTTYVKESQSLRGIKIEDSYAQAIDALAMNLNKQNFNYKTDRIFAYQDIPGFLTAIGAKSFSEAWIISGYKNSDDRTCLHMNLHGKLNPDIQIFVLSGEALDPKSKSIQCFNDKTQKAKNFTRKSLGDIYHYRNKKDITLTLSGPYTLR